MNDNLDPYENYVSTQLGHIHGDDYPMMSRYFHKNYARYIQSRADRILDVGFGMGHFLHFLKEYGCHEVSGIDLSQECVDYCLDRGLGTAESLQKSGMEEFLADKQEAFDIIVLNDVIEHFQKDALINNLKLIKNALRPGGRLIVKTLNSANPITASASRYIDFTHLMGFTEESMSQVLRLAGYSKVNVVPQDIWVFNPLVNLAGKLLQGFFNGLFRVLTLLYGRKTTRIFTKDIIAIAYR